MAKVLLVEDDAALAFSVCGALTLDNLIVEHAADGTLAMEYLRYQTYDLIILDWELPHISGLEICRLYRAANGKAPILFLTGQSAIENKIAGFETGADDYLTKPFDMRELKLRIRALLNRPQELAADTLEKGSILLNRSTRMVTISGAPLSLTPKEFDILELFMRNPEVLVDYDTLGRNWASEADATVYSMRPQISRLRKKLQDVIGVDVIESYYGKGYIFHPNKNQ